MSRVVRKISAALSRGSAVVTKAVLWATEWGATPTGAAALLRGFLALFLVEGLLGGDVGSHWDEWYHIQGVAGCIQRMSLMPDGLSYGGPYFTMGFPVVVAHQWHNLLNILRDMRTQPFRVDPAAFASVAHFKAEASALVNTPKYVLEVRSVFVAVTTLEVLWTIH